MKLELEVDVDKLREQIESATKIDDAESFFEEITKIEKAKKEIKDLSDQIYSMEQDVKGLINTKAKALYGGDWQVIKGERFKITRSKTGDVYLVNGTPSAKFTKVKVSVDSKTVDDYVTEHDKLPKGIEINDQRGESLRITIKEESWT